MLHIRNLYKSYGDTSVLQDLNLSIKTGEIYGLLGGNGAGKTTTINILCRLINADRGSILIDGISHTENTQALIGLVPQKNLIYGSLNCIENLSFFGKLYGLPKKVRKQRIPICLESVGLSSRKTCLAETLSGGMQRRLSIAVALMHRPKLLILDEPTTGLDIHSRAELIQLVQRLQQQGMTILLTTHLLDEAEQLCDRFGLLKQGHLIAEGTLSELQHMTGTQTVVTIKTPEIERAIIRANTFQIKHRAEDGSLILYPSKPMTIEQVILRFCGIDIKAIACEPVRLEHIYRELLQFSREEDSSQINKELIKTK